MAWPMRNPTKYRVLLGGSAGPAKGRAYTEADWAAATKLYSPVAGTYAIHTCHLSNWAHSPSPLPVLLYDQSNSLEAHCSHCSDFSMVSSLLIWKIRAKPPDSLGLWRPPAWLQLSLPAAVAHMEATRGPFKQPLSHLITPSKGKSSRELRPANWPVCWHLWASLLFTALPRLPVTNQTGTGSECATQ